MIDAQFIENVIEETGVVKFSHLNNAIKERLNGRPLTMVEKEAITMAIMNVKMRHADKERKYDTFYTDTRGGEDAEKFSQVMIVTAYTSDYTIGEVCELVNREYAAKHGYEFHSEVLNLQSLTEEISPKKHCSWYKILVLRKLLAQRELLASLRIRYLMWIDADAIVINSNMNLQDIIVRGCGKDLIIAEDMNPGCLLNSGVFMLRTTEWSADFLQQVWSSSRYNEVTFYEQSTMVRHLRGVHEGLESVKPFHSYLEGADPNKVKLFAHTAVLPCRELNTSKGVSEAEMRRHMAATGRQLNGKLVDDLSARGNDVSEEKEMSSTNNSDEMSDSAAKAPAGYLEGDSNSADGDVARFVYHVAGLPFKLSYLLTAVHKFGLDIDPELLRQVSHLKLVRGKNGQILSADLAKSRNLVVG